LFAITSICPLGGSVVANSDDKQLIRLFDLWSALQYIGLLTAEFEQEIDPNILQFLTQTGPKSVTAIDLVEGTEIRPQERFGEARCQA
jgi:hypothetical protein